LIFIGITLIISSLLLSLSLGSILNDSKIDIGIMMSSGIRKSDIRQIFIILSLFVSLLGVLFSMCLYRIMAYGINEALLKDIKLIEIPLSVPFRVVGLLIIFVIFFGLLSSLMTLGRLNRLQIGEIMREE